MLDQVALSKASKAEVASKQELDAALAKLAETESSAKQSIEQIAEAATYAVQQQVGIAKQQHLGKDSATEYRISGAPRHVQYWFGLVWFGLVWFGFVWFGLVWFGLVWFGLVWFVCEQVFELSFHGTAALKDKLRETEKALAEANSDIDGQVAARLAASVRLCFAARSREPRT
eukprot:SAG31_NODE_919_length_11010_cov_27.449821_6_plen_173_part_00